MEHEMNEVKSRGKYTLEFKQEAVRQVKGGRAASVVAKTLRMPKASLTNWVRADAKGQLGMSAERKPVAMVTPEQGEIARLRAELARVKMERDILKKAALDSTRRCNGSLKSTGRSFIVQRFSRPHVQTHGDRVQVFLAVDR